MKLITNLQNYKQLLLCAILSVLLIQTITTLNMKRSIMDATEESFLEESEVKKSNANSESDDCCEEKNDIEFGCNETFLSKYWTTEDLMKKYGKVGELKFDTK